jgi:hypothetical protein
MNGNAEVLHEKLVKLHEILKGEEWWKKDTMQILK